MGGSDYISIVIVVIIVCVAAATASRRGVDCLSPARDDDVMPPVIAINRICRAADEGIDRAAPAYSDM